MTDPGALVLSVSTSITPDSQLPAAIDEPARSSEAAAVEADSAVRPPPERMSPDANERPATGGIETPEPAAAEPSVSSPPEPAADAAVEVPRRENVRSSAKAPVRDLTYGDSAKALVDEAIWNMEPGDYVEYRTALQQGKSTAEAAQAAGGQLAIVHRRIKEYTVKIEALLSHSNASIEVNAVIEKPLEQATLEVIGSGALNDTEKDAAISHLGALQEEINRGLGRVISPHQAHRIARAVGDRANWGARSCLPEEVKPAYRAVFTSVRNAVLGAVPEAHILDERLANLYAAKCEIESELASKALHSVAR